MSTPDRLRAAIDRVSRWMHAHHASVLADNLAAGASQERLEETEKAFGFPLPPEVRALWSLHDGQKEECNGFVEWRDLLDTRRALDELDSALPNVEFLRQHPKDFAEAGITSEEVYSDHWVPVAGRDSDLILVSGVSGRVFTCGDQLPVVSRLAGSVTEWLEVYADRVEADDFLVEDGFGDCYLSERDRKAEARDAERARKAAERDKFERETPLSMQLAAAVQKQDGDAAQRVLERGHAEGSGPFTELVAALFASQANPDVVATALQPLLSAVTLTPDQWVRVATGGAMLENNAILDVAVAKSATCSNAAVRGFEADVAKAPEHQRARLRAVLKKVKQGMRRWWQF